VRTVGHLDLAKLVPAQGILSFEDLAKAASVNRQLLERIHRYCFPIGLFKESPPGQA
jgi:hypothetical protein